MGDGSRWNRPKNYKMGPALKDCAMVWDTRFYAVNSAVIVLSLFSVMRYSFNTTSRSMLIISILAGDTISLSIF